MSLSKEDFRRIKEDNSDEENERQWKHSEKAFEAFHEYLLNKKYNKSLAKRQVQNAVYFVLHYLFVYSDEESVLEVDDTTIRTFLGNFHIRKSWSTDEKEIKEILSALFDFFDFLLSTELIDKEQHQSLIETCRDKKWFEMRLETYMDADGDDFMDWIEEYNYD